MIQLCADDAKLHLVLKNILGDFLGIGDFEGDDKGRVVFFEITDEFSEGDTPRGWYLNPKRAPPGSPPKIHSGH